MKFLLKLWVDSIAPFLMEAFEAIDELFDLDSGDRSGCAATRSHDER